MTVYAIVRSLEGGYDHDKKQVKDAKLSIGDRFEVKYISMSQSHTDITLTEFGTFNSIYFDFEENGEPLNIFNDRRFNPYL